jgi:hypothetical protein
MDRVAEGVKNGIIDFLKTNRSEAELRTALEVLREFKKCESAAEWGLCPFQAWVKLEQLEEFLAYLTDKEPMKDDARAIAVRAGVVDALPGELEGLDADDEEEERESWLAFSASTNGISSWWEAKRTGDVIEGDKYWTPDEKFTVPKDGIYQIHLWKHDGELMMIVSDAENGYVFKSKCTLNVKQSK